MRERLVRVAGVATIIVLEADSPLRIYGPPDVDDAARCLVGHEGRRLSLASALRALASENGGYRRSAAWGRTLAREPGGITEAVERLLTDHSFARSVAK